MRLTDMAIRKLPAPSSGQKTYFDESVRGFGIRISQGGTKTFVVMYGEKRNLKTIGRYPQKTLKEARSEAMAFIAAPTAPPSRKTAEDAILGFLEHCKQRTSPRTKADYHRLLSKHFPKGRLANANRDRLLERLSELSDRPGEQSHAATAFGVFLNWCTVNGFIQGNPLAGIRGIGRIGKRERTLTDNELRTVFKKARADGHPFGHIIALCILTGQRRSEIANLRWEWISDNTITLPSHITKNRREHTIPYGALTATVLSDVPHNGDLLFPGRSAGVWNGWAKAKREFDPLDDHWQIHDLRRTFASKHAELGTPIHVVEKLLNHVSGSLAGVAGIYNRYSYLEEMRSTVQQYEDFIRSLVARA